MSISQADRVNFIVGSRKSKLALAQTRYVISTLQSLNPNLHFSIKERETTGDKIINVALSKIGDKGLFTQELEQDLIDNKIDFAVHSLKDLPCDLPENLTIGCILQRANPHDVLIVRSDLYNAGVRSLEDLVIKAPRPIVIGTSSLRRQAQLKSFCSEFQFYDVRGNLDTRIKKLEDSVFNQSDMPSLAAIVLAFAGMERQGPEYVRKISQIIPLEKIYYAVGQGALAVECRKDDTHLMDLLQSINHEETQFICTAERSLMRALKGGCHVPIGVSSELNNGILCLNARVLLPDGIECISLSAVGPLKDADKLGLELADRLLLNGADRILLKINSRAN